MLRAAKVKIATGDGEPICVKEAWYLQGAVAMGELARLVCPRLVLAHLIHMWGVHFLGARFRGRSESSRISSGPGLAPRASVSPSKGAGRA